MGMIQGIDGNVLLQALRAGRNDRMQDMEFQAKQAKSQAEARKQQQIGGLMGNLFGGAPAGGGVEGQFAPSNPVQQPQTFDQAFGAGIPPAAAPGPVAAPTAPTAPSRRPNPEVLAQLIALDPETGGKLASAFKTMDEANLKNLEAKNTALGAGARWLERQPESERAAAMQIILPQLMASGWTEQEIIGKPLTNQALRGYQAQAIDVDKMIDNELAEREFMAGKTVAVPEGGSVANIRPQIAPDGSVSTTAEYVIAPAGAGGGAPDGVAAPATKADYDALPAGSTYQAPDGSIRTKPGGQTGSAPSGDFRP